MRDNESDAEAYGTAPEYTEIVAACLREGRRDLRLELTFAGRVPERMPDEDTTMGVGFELERRSGEKTYVFADADGSGWTAYITYGEGRRRLPDALLVDGRKLVITADWSALKMARRIWWFTESTWISSGLLSTSYAFDVAPNDRERRFRRRR